MRFHPLRADSAERPARINAGARAAERFFIYVRAANLDVQVGASLDKRLHNDGDRVGFLARGACRAPDSQLFRGGLRLNQRGKQSLFKKRKLTPVAEEMRLTVR